MRTHLRARLLGLKILDVQGTVLVSPPEPPVAPAYWSEDPPLPSRTVRGEVVGTRLALNAQRLEENGRSLHGMNGSGATSVPQ